MSRTVIAAVDGSAESSAAAEWAAGEARRRGLPLRLLRARRDRGQPAAPTSGPGRGAPSGPDLPSAPAPGAVPRPRHPRGPGPLPTSRPDAAHVAGPGAARTAGPGPAVVRRPAGGAAPGGPGATGCPAGQTLHEVAERLRAHHPGLTVTVEQLPGRPVEVLLSAARKAEVLVLGSGGPGALGGLLPGAVSLPVVAHATRPVVVVRTGGRAGNGPRSGSGTGPDAPGACPDVVLGLDLSRPCDELIGYAFEAAAVRAATLRVVHGWSGPLGTGTAPAAGRPGGGTVPEHDAERVLADALRPWRGEFPGVEVTAQCVVGRAADHLVAAAGGASLLVVGRRIRRSPLGTRIGPVTHAVLHHATTPVAVVPHL
ncbi:universal stress protein [Streptomyces pactum]|uniref:universal stress protein n=1 Tax=Streptomyces pactum TaxID=68249 RepID=UPI0036F8017F